MIDGADELVAEKLAEGRVWFDLTIEADMREIIVAAQGLEHIPRVIDFIRQRRARLIAWREIRLAELEAALLAEVSRWEF